MKKEEKEVDEKGTVNHFFVTLNFPLFASSYVQKILMS
jgi:hypothetical protein